ncbi:RNA 2',3'-cyclic phosphodiesterase [Tepidicaulis sp.]|jgi:2'-5' RNA ligase|uniref:RNA 2',3'-cyclic phosphodiesterase n=1 Tax=Tepidicaulis sp. TaxID=1920809 RepID=UPI003B5929FC
MIRLFTALEIPLAIAGQLTALQSGLKGARWIDPEAMHITLRFIGEVPEDTAHDIDRALSGIYAAPFDITLDGIGEFGGRKPHAVWARVADNPGLMQLQARQETALQRAGLAPDRRKYTPHATLARLRRGTDPADVMRYIERNNLFRAGPFPVSRFVLMSSRLSQGGGPYITERAYDFTNPGGLDEEELEEEEAFLEAMFAGA